MMSQHLAKRAHFENLKIGTLDRLILQISVRARTLKYRHHGEHHREDQGD